MMRVIVCGGRDFDDRSVISKALSGLPIGAILVHGDCDGADKMAAKVWEFWNQTCEPHPADWDRHGKAAGPIRNQEIVDLGAHHCIAFPGGAGTADCIRRCEAAGIQVKKVGKKAKKQ